MEMKDKSDIRLGIMGCGAIAHAMAEAALHTPHIILSAVASRSLVKAERFNEKYHAPYVFDSYEAMVKSDAVDLIYIATPHGLHHEHIKLCLDHHKHVLCEKAFTINAELARPLIQQAKQKKLFLMEAMWTRFLPSTQMIQDVLTSKLLGDIQSVSINFGSRMSYDASSRLWNPRLGGGALLDIGVYPLTMMSLLFGKPESMHSTVEFTPNGVDQKATLKLTYHGFDAILNISFIEDLSPNALIINGSQETLVSDRFWMSSSVSLMQSNEQFDFPFDVNGYEYELYESALMIQNHHIEHPIMSHQMTLDMLEWMDEIRASWGLKYPVE
ncbi:MAG: Gfo/Idh/MocA family protein [Acholeplasmataceae bacterium]